MRASDGVACIGGFVDSQLNAALDLDSARSGALYAVALGLAETLDDHGPTDSFGG